MQRRLSPLVLAGVLVCGVGAAGDIAYHTAVPQHPHPTESADAARTEALFGPDGQRAHIVTLAGMVLTLAGIVAGGLERKARADATPF